MIGLDLRRRIIQPQRRRKMADKNIATEVLETAVETATEIATGVVSGLLGIVGIGN